MDLPFAGRRLKPNFSGVIALIFQLILSKEGREMRRFIVSLENNGELDFRKGKVTN